MARIKYERVLLKLSGEAMSGESSLDPDAVATVARSVKAVYDLGAQLAVVVGAGNMLRGAAAADKGGRIVADKMGMLGTAINALALHGGLQILGVRSEVLSAVHMPQICSTYTDARAATCLDQGAVVVFAGGTGHPFFTTDTAASLRAAQIGADLIIKATKVDGVYSGDPVVDEQARLHENITYDKVLEENLKVMDAASIALCRDNGIPVRVCNMADEAVLSRIVRGEAVGTMIS